MKQMKTDILRTAAALTAYVKRTRYAAAALTAYVFLLHFRLLSSLIPGIDTEHIISSSEQLYQSWLGIGRQGLVFTKQLFGTTLFNPDFAAALTLLLLVPVCLLIPFLFALVSGRTEGYPGESWLALLLGMCIVSHPVLTEQLYFTLQSMEVVFSFLLLELCLLGAHFWSDTKNAFWLPPVILLLLIPFSSYQAFVPLFIAGAVLMALVQSIFTKKALRAQLYYIGRMIFVFLGGFLLNQLITRLFFTSSSYLNEQFYWKKAGFWGGCREILLHIWNACAGGGSFYFIEFGLLCLMLLFLMLSFCLQHKKERLLIWRLFLLCCWFASPFYLSVLLGIRPVVRAQLVLPFATGGTAFLCGLLFLDRKAPGQKKLRHIAGLLLLLLCLSTAYREAAVTSRLYYADAVRERGDYALAVSLQESIQAATGVPDYNGSIIFWGRREAAKNASCIQGDVMGQSFFNWDVDVEPYSFYSSNRIVSFLNSLGSSLTSPTQEQARLAAGYVGSMPCYPAPGSIVSMGDALLIKLSDE